MITFKNVVLTTDLSLNADAAATTAGIASRRQQANSRERWILRWRENGSEPSRSPPGWVLQRNVPSYGAIGSARDYGHCFERLPECLAGGENHTAQ